MSLHRNLAPIVGVGFLYYTAARLGLLLAFQDTNSSAVLLPAGIAFGLVWVVGRRIWPGILVGAAAAHMHQLLVCTVPPPTAAVIASTAAVGNTLEALIGVGLLRRFVGRRTLFQDARHVFGLAAAALVAGLVGSLFGASGMCAAGFLPWTFFGASWLTGWLGDAVAILVIAPLILAWSGERAPHRRGIETAVLLLSLCIVTQYVFGAGFLGASIERYRVPYLVVPFFLWGAFRLDLRAVAAAAALASIIAIRGTIGGFGPFVGEPLHNPMIELQLFVGMVSLTAMLLSASVSQLRRSEELLESERELHESQQRFRNLFNALPEMIWLAGPDKGAVDFNEQWLKFRGRPIEQELGEGWADGVHVDDYDRCLETYASRFDARLPLTMEYRLQRADGEYRWILDSGVPCYRSDGEFAGYVGSCLDITARKAAEEDLLQLRLAVENAMTGISRLNAEGRFTMVRTGYARVLGYEPDEMIGSSWKTTVPEEDHPAAIEAAQRVLVEGRAEVEIRGLRKDGTTLHAHLLLVQAPGDEDGGHYCFMRDISDQVRSEQERRRLEDELRQAQKMDAIGTLASGVAHDFNNLMTVINGYVESAELLLPTGHAARSDLRMVTSTATQGAGVSQSLLTFAQRATAEKAKVELCAIVEESFGILRRLLPASVELVEAVPSAANLWIEANSARIQQVVINLAVNARDALGAGGQLRISLQEATASDTGRREAVILVTDHGVGMTRETISRVFEPFYTTKTREHGTGLGLAITHGIVRDHGGTITIKSNREEGTTVTVRLPRCEAPKQAPVDEERPAVPALGGETILVAEDNADVRLLITRFLERARHEVIAASDGEEALRLFERRRADLALVVLDLDLPKQPGRVCLSKIREQRPDMPVIIVSGNADQQLSADDLAREIVLRKPFGMAELVQSVESVLSAVP